MKEYMLLRFTDLQRALLLSDLNQLPLEIFQTGNLCWAAPMLHPYTIRHNQTQWHEVVLLSVLYPNASTSQILELSPQCLISSIDNFDVFTIFMGTLSFLISVQHNLILFQKIYPLTCIFTQTNEKKSLTYTYFHLLAYQSTEYFLPLSLPIHT